VGELRKAQLSRHLLLLRTPGAAPAWYAGPDVRRQLADPMLALHTAAILRARRTGAAPAPVVPWLGEPVEPAIERLAAGANTDHRVRWRLRNLTVEPATVYVVVAAWHSGAARPRAGAGGADSPRRALEQSDRLRLVLELLRSERDRSLPPGGGVRPGTDAPPGGNHGTCPQPYLQKADAAYLQGDHDAALAGYLAGLAESPDEIALWGGLASVAPWEILRERPELVRAARRALSVDLDTLVRWWGR
jgi:hypothetical protein